MLAPFRHKTNEGDWVVSCGLVKLSGAGLHVDPTYVQPLPEGYGRWSYPSVFVYHDRVLIAHTYSKHDRQAKNHGGSRLKVLPLKWFYGDADPQADNPNIRNAFRPATPQREAAP